MKHTLIGCLTLLSTGLFSSCQKVIDLHLKSSEKEYVIEGTVSDRPGTCKVLLSQTGDFDEDNTFQGVSDAIVSIADNMGDTVRLSEISSGVYEDSSFTGMTGHTYTLQVYAGGQLFTASSTMPSFVPLDSAYIIEEGFFGKTSKQLNILYRDPAGQKNYYRFEEFVNSMQVKQIFVRDDELTDGKAVIATLRYQDAGDDVDNVGKIQTGDTVHVNMECIDSAVYKYWSSLESSATGSSQSASPANPVSNIQGGALGYFSAQTIEQRMVISP